jgi:hypothetical protein
VTRPQIRAIIDDGPRGGETLELDAESGGSPPREVMLPDGHMGARPPGGEVPHPTGSVSRYRLVDDSGDGTGYHYKVVPHDQ